MAYWNLNDEFLDITFVQVKAIQKPNEANLKKKADEGLYQAEEDIRAFYAIHPDFTPAEKARIGFTTMVALPTVSRKDPAGGTCFPTYAGDSGELLAGSRHVRGIL